MNTLLDMVRGYQELLERKDQLADETKANNAAIEEAKNEIAQVMMLHLSCSTQILRTGRKAVCRRARPSHPVAVARPACVISVITCWDGTQPFQRLHRSQWTAAHDTTAARRSVRCWQL